MRKLVAIVPALLIVFNLLSCKENPTQPENLRDDEYEMSAWFLGIYYIFRDKLPQDLYSFPTPKELYASVDDPYTEYFNPEEAEVFLSFLDTKTVGFGISIDSTQTGYTITRVIAASPADNAGLMIDDTLQTVNGTNIVGSSREQLDPQLTGAIGDEKTLILKRGTEQLTITVTLDEFFAPSVYTDSLDTKVAYIQLTTFLTETGTSGGSAQEFSTALQNTAWAEYTIFDLRFNGGGEFNQSLDIASEFVAAETPLIDVQQRVLNNTTGTGETIANTLMSLVDGTAKDRKFYVLINGSTASASELLLSALASNRDDIISVGSRTFGKARGQVLSSTPELGLVKVTNSVIIPIVGSSYDNIGILPDITISVSEDALDVALHQIIASTSKALAGAESRNIARVKSVVKSQSKKPFVPLNVSRSSAGAREAINRL
jgi:carboxyl-terminal processing protease